MPVGYGEKKAERKKRNERNLKSSAFSVLYDHKKSESRGENDPREKSDDNRFIPKKKTEAKHQFNVAAADPAPRRHHNDEQGKTDRERADQMLPPKNAR